MRFSPSNKLRLYISGLALVIIIALSLFFGSRILAKQPIRNVVLISIDTCRSDYLSCYGYPVNTTPNIDAIADEGVLFENVISPVPLTLPGHVSMLTGTIPPFHGVHDNIDSRLEQSNVTLAEVLSEKGFTTGAIVSSFVLNSLFGLSQGFQTYDDVFQEEHHGSGFSERLGSETSRVAVDWIGKHKDEKFFLFLHYYDPHAKYEPPEPFASRFPMNSYAGEIAYTDHCIGQVIKNLKELGLYDSTLIIVTSDHGEMLGEHNEKEHGYFIYQGAIKVPLIFKLPGKNRNKRIKRLVGLIDIVPTVYSLLDIDPLPDLHGMDLSASLLGKKQLPVRHMYSESLYATKYNANSLLGIVTDRFKYIQTTRPELYDLIKDPYEKVNLVDKQPQRALILQDQLKQILEMQSKTITRSEFVSDPESKRRLESLGYIAGDVDEDFEFDQSREDPKDLLEFHHSLASMRHLMDAKKYVEAINACKKLILQKPNIQILHLSMAVTYLKLEDYSQAVKYYEQSLRLNPDDYHIYNDLGVALMKLDRLDEAADCFEKLLTSNPQEAEPHYNLGIIDLGQDKVMEAGEHFEKYLNLMPDNLEKHMKVIAILIKAGQREMAISYSKKLFELTEDISAAHQDISLLFYHLDEVDLAVKHLTEAIGLEPTNLDIIKKLAWIRLTGNDPNIRNPSDAVKLAQKACELTDYADPNMLDILARAYLAKENFMMAISYYRDILKIDSDRIKTRLFLADLLVGQGKLDEAVKHYRKVLQLDPNYTNVHLYLGMVFSKQDKLDKAIDSYQRALLFDPNSVKAHTNLAESLQSKGKVLDAIKHYRQALRIEPDRVSASNNLAWLLATHKDRQIRNPKEAILLAENACQLTNYENSSIIDTLAAAYAADSRFPEAVNSAKMALEKTDPNQKAIIMEIQRHLKLYENGQMYTEP